MNNENSNDEIDLVHIFGVIKKVVKNLLRGVVSILFFYKKKTILLVTLIVLGVIAGFFMDQYRGTKTYIQEIIIEPKFNSTKFVYDFIEEFGKSLRDEQFLEELGMTLEDIKNVKEVSISPLIRRMDILGEMKKIYEEEAFFEEVIDAFDEDQMSQEKFRDFYRYHKITLKFKVRGDYKISEAILKYIKSNEYYKNIAEFIVEQNTNGLKQSKETLSFLNKFLENIKDEPLGTNKETLVVSNTSEPPIMTVASLLRQKQSLLEEIRIQEKVVKLDREIIYIVDYGSVFSRKRELHKRIMIILPILLFVLVSLFYLLKFVSKEVNSFIEEG